MERPLGFGALTLSKAVSASSVRGAPGAAFARAHE